MSPVQAKKELGTQQDLMSFEKEMKKSDNYAKSLSKL